MKKKIITTGLAVIMFLSATFAPGLTANAAGGWIQEGSRWWYQHSDGGYTSSGWEYINGQWYLFDNTGWMLTGWQQVNGSWYYMDNSGAMAANRWVGNYYVTGSGAMAVNTWVGNYYVGADGAWIPGYQPAGWIQSGNRWWYRHADGSYTKNGWEYINGQWYLFDSAGWMLTGWQQVNGSWYYMYGSGAMAANTWIGNYYVTASGAMATNTWIGQYYVGTDGAWVPNAQQPGNDQGSQGSGGNQPSQDKSFTIDLGNGETAVVAGYHDAEKALEVIDLLNEYRVSQDLSELEIDDELMEAAKVRAYEISNSFSHTRPNGEICFTLSDAIFGENIAAGQTTAGKVMGDWKSSPGHNANMLGERYTKVGVALFVAEDNDGEGYSYYWVQLFGM